MKIYFKNRAEIVRKFIPMSLLFLFSVMYISGKSGETILAKKEKVRGGEGFLAESLKERRGRDDEKDGRSDK